MKFIVSGKNIVVTEALKERAIKKVGKLDKYFQRDAEAQITMSVQKNRHIVEVTILLMEEYLGRRRKYGHVCFY